MCRRIIAVMDMTSKKLYTGVGSHSNLVEKNNLNENDCIYAESINKPSKYTLDHGTRFSQDDIDFANREFDKFFSTHCRSAKSVIEFIISQNNHDIFAQNDYNAFLYTREMFVDNECVKAVFNLTQYPYTVKLDILSIIKVLGIESSADSGIDFTIEHHTLRNLTRPTDKITYDLTLKAVSDELTLRIYETYKNKLGSNIDINSIQMLVNVAILSFISNAIDVFKYLMGRYANNFRTLVSSDSNLIDAWKVNKVYNDSVPLRLFYDKDSRGVAFNGEVPFTIATPNTTEDYEGMEYLPVAEPINTEHFVNYDDNVKKYDANSLVVNSDFNVIVSQINGDSFITFVKK
jgi:hypothetical protein